MIVCFKEVRNFYIFNIIFKEIQSQNKVEKSNNESD